MTTNANPGAPATASLLAWAEPQPTTAPDFASLMAPAVSPVRTTRPASVSVVVPAYNASSTIGACLAGLQAQCWPSGSVEIIVIDDGSTDTTGEIIRAARVTCVRAPHGGPAAGRNLGASVARGDLLVFTDADCVPAPNWLEELTRPFDDPAVAGAKGAYRTAQPELVARFVQQEYQEKYARMARQPVIDFIDTYSAAYRRELFLASGGFDTTFPTASVEDQEFSFRLARQGYPLRFVPEALVEHQHDRTPAEYVRRKFWIGYWKAQLLRQYPEKALGDSHTPLTQRLQLGLLALTVLCASAAPLYPPLALAALACAGLFLATAIPLAWQVAQCDPAVLAVLPLMLLLRAAALGAGLVAGAARSSRRLRPGPSWPASLCKRVIDITAASLGLALAWPLMAGAAVWIKLDSPGPALFVQTRVGQYGRLFRMYKLRTMACGGSSPDSSGGVAAKKPGDPRVTRAGRWLRRWSVDELPQLVNVLRGDMSLVGPRPEEPQIVAGYTARQRRRLAVRPGLTGPMQVNGRADLELEARVQLELDYIEHYSLARDVDLLLDTVPAVISGRGAY